MMRVGRSVSLGRRRWSSSSILLAFVAAVVALVSVSRGSTTGVDEMGNVDIAVNAVVGSVGGLGGADSGGNSSDLPAGDCRDSVGTGRARGSGHPNPLMALWRVFTSEEEQAENIARIKEENDWKNSLVLSWMLPAEESRSNGRVADLVRSSRFLSSWIRNWFMATTLYFVVGGLWAYYCYYCFGDSLYESREEIPSLSAMVAQMRVAFMAMPLYAMLPAATEQIVEAGWTLSYARIDDVGVGRYVLYFALYMASVEFCVYWQHRNLHDFRTGYKYLHKYHHIYNKDNTLSPFAGLAFHPLDGILQAVPYTWTLFYIPQHFMTHELLLFLTAIWTTSIHDCVHVRMDPIMGAGYHKLHHLKYTVNHGHYFWYMDRIFGTLLYPEDYAREKKERLMRKVA